MTISIPVNGHLRCGVPALKVSPYLQKVAGPKETALLRSYKRHAQIIVAGAFASLNGAFCQFP
jgi:hypothetical protein